MVEPRWAGREDADPARRLDRSVPAERSVSAVSTRRPPTTRAPLNAQAVLGLQRAAGNAAVAGALAGRRPAGPAGAAGPLVATADAAVAAAPAESSLALVTELRPLAPEGSPATGTASAADGSDPTGTTPDLFLLPEPAAEEGEPAALPPVVQRWSNPLARVGSIARGGVDLVHSAVDSVGDLAGAALGAARARIAGLTTALRSGGQTVQAAASAVSAGVGTAVWNGSQAIGQLGSQISTGLSQGLSAATGTLNGLTSGFSGLMRRGLSAVSASAGALGRSLAAMDAEGIRGAWARIQSVVGQSFGQLTAAGSALTQRAESLWAGLTQRFGAATERLSSFGTAMLGRLRAAASAAVASVTTAWQGLSQRAAQMDGMGGTLARVAVAVVERLMSGLKAVWQQVSAAWTAVQAALAEATTRVSTAITTARDAASRQLQGLVDRARASVTALVTRARALAQRSLGGLAGLVGRLSGFSLDKLVSTVSVISRFLGAVNQARSEASAALEQRAEQISAMIQPQMPGAAAEQVRQHVGGAGSGPAGPAIQRRVAVQRDSVRSTMGVGGALSATWSAITHKWDQISIKKLVVDALWTFIWPWPAVGHEFVELWHDWKSAAHRLFTPRGSSFGTFVQDLWTNVLTLLDFPNAIIRRLVRMVGALMGWVTIILVGGGAVLVGALGSLLGPEGTVAGAIAGAGAGLALAGAAGEAALAAFAAVELTALVKRLAELVTGSLTAEEQDENVQNSADSAVGLGVAASVAAIMWLASRIASAAVNAVRRLRAPTKVETPPPEETTTPPEVTTKPGAPLRPGETPTHFGERLGTESRGQPSRFDYVVEQINVSGLSQADAEAAAAAATKAVGLRLVRVAGGAGNTYLSSVMPGQSRPILIVRASGSVARGTADIAVANPPSLERPFELTNIKDANGNPAEPTPVPPTPQLDPPEFKNAAEEASFERFRRLPGFVDRVFGKSPTQEIDWVDSEGRTYDQIGNPRTSQFWDQQRTNFMNQIDRHIGKADVVVLDLTGFTPDQVAEVRTHVEGLPPAQQAKIVRIGF